MVIAGGQYAMVEYGMIPMLQWFANNLNYIKLTVRRCTRFTVTCFVLFVFGVQFK